MIGKLPRNGRIVSVCLDSGASQNVYGKNRIPWSALGPQEAPVESAAEPVTIGFYTGEDMLPTVLSEINETKTSICGPRYVDEHTECFVKMVWNLVKGVRVRIAIDKMNFTKSSCARQAIRIRELWDAVCEIKTVNL
jgi:hypothetical protein